MERHWIKWIETVNAVKVKILLKAINRFSTMPVKTPMIFFLQKQKSSTKIYIEYQRTQIAKT